MGHRDIRLTVAEARTIYDVAAIDRAMEETAGNRNEALASLYDKMKQRGGERFLIRPTHADMVDDLYESCPNFDEVIDDIKKHLALSVAGNEPTHFTPILLLGEPGIGKTHFARELANRLGTGHEFVSMSSLTAGWVLSGASAQWNNAKPGKVAHTLVHGDFANPIVVLDEIDKAGGDSRYDPYGALYSLLENDTARAFKDEFVDIDIDASHILWVTTANDERGIPEPILNRMNVYEVPRPDHDASLRIARSLYSDSVSEHDWGFPPEPDDSVLERLASLPPRDMKKRLLAAFGTAKLAGRNWLETSDFEQARSGRSRKIGF
ncbi:MAG: AAA family ATPase [Azonexus sp.]|nr:AAA family ATPase [Azonexus sp.]